jgi:hypothetical protein
MSKTNDAVSSGFILFRKYPRFKKTDRGVRTFGPPISLYVDEGRHLRNGIRCPCDSIPPRPLSGLDMHLGRRTSLGYALLCSPDPRFMDIQLYLDSLVKATGAFLEFTISTQIFELGHIHMRSFDHEAQFPCRNNNCSPGRASTVVFCSYAPHHPRPRRKSRGGGPL